MHFSDSQPYRHSGISAFEVTKSIMTAILITIIIIITIIVMMVMIVIVIIMTVNSFFALSVQYHTNALHALNMPITKIMIITLTIFTSKNCFYSRVLSISNEWAF